VISSDSMLVSVSGTVLVVVGWYQSSEEDGWTQMRMENDQLLRRVTELQQQSWMLEEKVSCLWDVVCSVFWILFYRWLVTTSLLCPSVVGQVQYVIVNNVMLSSCRLFVTLCLWHAATDRPRRDICVLTITCHDQETLGHFNFWLSLSLSFSLS